MCNASAPAWVRCPTPEENTLRHNYSPTKEEVLSLLTFVASFACFYLFIYLFINFQCLPNRLVQSPENYRSRSGGENVHDSDECR